jgi:hypothetical protein
MSRRWSSASSRQWQQPWGLAFGFSSEQTGLISALISAIGVAYVSRNTEETWASAIIQAFSALIAVGIGFGLHISDQAANLLIGVATSALALINRTQVTPVAKLAELSENASHFRPTGA